ncbi:BTAD domain-containing putative transcriptional regulator [Plantactinospora sp. B5E13]|uniref:AfsR/SARP family transcriptional regulator n=1 Tax=unclassified Plantactinospora TaxID=2631981 RepID=UPI00325E8966
MTDVDAFGVSPVATDRSYAKDGAAARRLVVQLFGRTAAWRGSEEIPLGPAGQRALFAVLALSAGQPVIHRELVEALWTDEPPREATNIIQTYVKRLRRALEPERPPRMPSDLLVRVGDGYALRVDPACVDLRRFRTMVDAARTARRQGDHQRVVLLLDEAMRTWQSPLLADIPALANHPLLTATANERLTAVCWHAEAALGLGAADEVLAAVARAAAAAPLHEGIHAWLIRLHWAIGQRAEGLAVYRRIAQRLARELGVEPGPELTGLRRAMMRPGPRGGRVGAARRSSHRPVRVHWRM